MNSVLSQDIDIKSYLERYARLVRNLFGYWTYCPYTSSDMIYLMMIFGVFVKIFSCDDNTLKIRPEYNQLYSVTKTLFTIPYCAYGGISSSRFLPFLPPIYISHVPCFHFAIKHKFEQECFMSFCLLKRFEFKKLRTS